MESDNKVSELRPSSYCDYILMCISLYLYVINRGRGIPWWLSGKESSHQCRRHRFDPWVEKIPWRKKWQPIPGFLPGKSHGQVDRGVWQRLAATVYGVTKESGMTQQLNNSTSGGRSGHSLLPEAELVWIGLPTAAAVPAGGWARLLVFIVSSALGDVGKEGRVSQGGPPGVFSLVT